MDLTTLLLPFLAADPTEAVQVATENAKSLAPLAKLGAGLGAGLVCIGAARGIGAIGAKAVESIARQPEVKGAVQTAMIISAALIEGFTFFALVVCMQALG